MKAWLCQLFRIWPHCERSRSALVKFTLQRKKCTLTCVERDFWAIRRSLPDHVDRLVSYPLVFIYLKSKLSTGDHSTHRQTHTCTANVWLCLCVCGTRLARGLFYRALFVIYLDLIRAQVYLINRKCASM